MHFGCHLSKFSKCYVYCQRKFYCTANNISRITQEDQWKLTGAVKSLKYHEYSSLIFLKLKGSNAEDGVSFSNASCRLRSSIEPDAELNIRRKRYGYASLFHPGVKILENFLKDPSDVPKDHARFAALKRLIDIVPKVPAVSKRLQGVFAEQRSSETEWTVQLIHHYLKELSVNQSYLIDHNSRLTVRRCECCNERITGDYGDTSIGNESVWHGSVDVMLGIQNVPVSFIPDVEEMEVETDTEGETFTFLDDQSSFEGTGRCDLHHEEKLVSQAIVFAFLQRRLRLTDYKHFLIPTIGMSKKQAVIYFYDPDHDILMKNLHPFELFGEEDGGLYYATIIALWLAVNYPILGSGVGKSMKSTGFMADFKKDMSQEVQDIYDNQLRFGGVKSKPKDIELPKFLSDVEFDDPLVPSLGQV